MRHFVIASVVTGSTLVATAASAQQLQYGTSPAPAPTYAPAPVQPAPIAPAPAQPPSAPPQYGQPAPTQGAPPAPQPQPQPQPQAPPQYGQPAPQPPPPQQPPQYAPPQQPQQYGQPQQQQPGYGQPQSQPGYGQQASLGSGAPPPEMGPPVAATWRAGNSKFIIAGERLFGFSLLKATISSPGGQDITSSSTMVNLLAGNASTEVNGNTYVNPFAMPMLTFHGVFGGGITAGGGIGYASTTGEREGTEVSTGNKITVDAPTRSGFAFAPRFGFLASFSPVFSIWAKGGITYWSQQSEDPNNCNQFGNCNLTVTESVSGLAFSLDPMFVLAPIPHVGIMFGPTIDVGLSGTRTRDGHPDVDVMVSNYGIQAGLALMF